MTKEKKKPPEVHKHEPKEANIKPPLLEKPAKRKPNSTPHEKHNKSPTSEKRSPPIQLKRNLKTTNAARRVELFLNQIFPKE